MLIVTVDSTHPEPDRIARAAAILRSGGLVAFPTETVYGLGANALDPVAVQRIYDAKGRPAFNPLIAHVHDPAAARRLVRDWPGAADLLARLFWPGPLTMVLPRTASVPDAVTAGLDTVAVRIPAHPVALALIRAADLPIAAPSANRFTELSPTCAAHVQHALGDRVDLILDGGATTVGIESTVVDLSGSEPVLLRPGHISAAQLREVLGSLVIPAKDPDACAPRAAPGMLERHYAPRARLRPFAATERDLAARLARELASHGKIVGALLLGPFDAPVAHPVRMPPDPAGYARELYATLHALDAQHCDVVFVEEPDSAGDEWAAIRDRLHRGAGQ